MIFRDYNGFRENVCVKCTKQCEQTDGNIDNCYWAYTPFGLGGDARTPQH